MSASTIMLMITTFTALCSSFAAVVPPPAAGSSKWLIYAYRAICVCGINVGYAKNAKQAGE